METKQCPTKSLDNYSTKLNLNRSVSLHVGLVPDLNALHANGTNPPASLIIYRTPPYFISHCMLPRA
jgi:hypothetical protein